MTIAETEMPTPRICGLYVITDPLLLDGSRLLPACEAALRGGARILQYRDKPATGQQRLQRAASLRDLCRDHGALLLINDDAALAARVGADGVHLGQTDGAIADARHRLGEQAIIGVTCHDSVMLAQAAIQEGADYVAFGRFFPSRTKPGASSATLDILRHPLPTAKVAIGGITPENAAPLIDAGANALAVIHGVFGQQTIAEIESTARQLSSLFG